MTTGGLLVIVIALGFTLAGWLLAMFTRHQAEAHIAARDRMTSSISSTDKPGIPVDLDLHGSFTSGVRVYATKTAPRGRIVVGSVEHEATIAHEG